MPAALLVALLVAAGLVLHWYVRTRSLAWQVQKGFEVFDAARTPEQVRAALSRWSDGMQSGRGSPDDGLVDYLLERCSLDDRRVQRLLAALTGADFRDRHSDWERWRDAHAALRARRPLPVSRKQSVQLEPRWTAAVGLTAWFTTIIPLDGSIYVASLGGSFADPEDLADGVVRVDAQSGESELLFAPPDDHHGSRDIIGLAAGTRCLFAACRNGHVYCLSPAGELEWSAHVAAPIAAAPLTVDTNRDSTTDVIVATLAGDVVALSGRNGHTTWVTSIADVALADEALMGTTLALGQVLPRDEAELIVTTPDGIVALLAVRDGRSLWRHQLAAGTLTGPVCHGGLEHGAARVHLGDRAANMWALVQGGSELTPAMLDNLSLRDTTTLIAGLRTLGKQPDSPPLLVACPTGDYAGRCGGVCALGPDGVRWRVPVGGAVWGTPAVADLNADGRSDIVVASIVTDEDGQVRAALTILSDAGHYLAHRIVPAPVECSPIVADVDGDSRLEVLVADQSGHLHCFATRGYGPVEWGLPAGDSHNTRNAAYAYEFGQLAPGLQWDWQPR